MSSASKPQPLAADLNPDDVAEFLQAHPEFFEHNPALLDGLQIPHQSGAAVSLIERQVTTLRQKNRQLERKLRDLVDIARRNDLLAHKVHGLATQLMAARTRVQAVQSAEQLLRSSFEADQAVLVLFEHVDGEFDSLVESGRFLRLIDRGNTALGPFRTFLEGGAPRCGKIRDSQREFLFGEDADEIGSAALVPLGEQAATGFLGIGSRDANYFHPGMSMDFLARLGDLLGCALTVR